MVYVVSVDTISLLLEERVFFGEPAVTLHFGWHTTAPGITHFKLIGLGPVQRNVLPFFSVYFMLCNLVSSYPSISKSRGKALLGGGVVVGGFSI